MKILTFPLTEIHCREVAFSGGGTGRYNTQSSWNQKYQTMRADKLKTEVVEKNNENTGNISRSQRPNAFTMMKNFYDGYVDVSMSVSVLTRVLAYETNSEFQ